MKETLQIVDWALRPSSPAGRTGAASPPTPIIANRNWTKAPL